MLRNIACIARRRAFGRIWTSVETFQDHAFAFGVRSLFSSLFCKTSSSVYVYLYPSHQPRFLSLDLIFLECIYYKLLVCNNLGIINFTWRAEYQWFGQTLGWFDNFFFNTPFTRDKTTRSWYSLEYNTSERNVLKQSLQQKCIPTAYVIAITICICTSEWSRGNYTHYIYIYNMYTKKRGVREFIVNTYEGEHVLAIT